MAFLFFTKLFSFQGYSSVELGYVRHAVFIYYNDDSLLLLFTVTSFMTQEHFYENTI